MKKHILKHILIFIVIMLAIVAVAFIYIAHNNVQIRKHYENLTHISLMNAKTDFNNEINKIFLDLDKAHTENLLPEGYYATGKLYTDKKMTIRTSTGEQNTDITQNKYLEITSIQKNISVFIKDSQEYVLFSYKNGDFYQLLFLQSATFSQRLGISELDNVLLTNKNGVILASIKEVTEETIYKVASYEKIGNLHQEKSAYVNQQYISVMKMDEQDFFIIGIADTSQINQYIENDRKTFIFFVIAAGCVSFIGAFLIILLNIINNNRNLNGKIAKGKYSLVVDMHGRVIFRNKKFRQEFKTYKEIISYTVESKEQIRKSLLQNGDITLKLKNNKGQQKYIRLMTSRALIGFRMLGSDVTEIMQDYLDAKYKANCNHVTGLPNTKQLRLDYQEVLHDYKDDLCCIALIELVSDERLKVMFGNRFYGDALRKFAQTLEKMFKGMIYHNGFNRFFIFTHKTEITEQFMRETSKYASILDAPLNVGDNCIILEYKMGISKAFYPRDRFNLDIPVRQAKQVLNSIKKSVSKKYSVFYDVVMREDIIHYEKKQAILDLLDKNDLFLHFQPQYSIKENKIIGFEALTRINKKLNITIMEFIELAEKNGSMIELGTVVYKKAMDFAQEIDEEDIVVSINVSPIQLLQEGFVESFLSEFKKRNLKKNSIAIEITESFLMTSQHTVIPKLNMLREQGIAIHLDDFGIEYSSMLYLKKLPISAIKIDKEFISDIESNPYSSLITKTIIELTNKLGLDCIAEGVESKEQLDALRKLNCDIIQGYYISKAVPKEKAMQIYKEYNKK